MAEENKGGKKGWVKAGLGAVIGLFSGGAAMYATAVFNLVVKPPKPVANFAVAADGLTVTCSNRASGESGWWDFGDGSPLEPFDAAQQSVQHTYAKPGSYAVKLTVRNFLLDENDRSVPVDLSAAAPQQLPPSILNLQVEAVGPQAVAPATFRVRGEVKNAERVIWDLGGDKPEVSTENGPFERLVVFERPGQFPIQLTGLTGTNAVKESKTVTVASPAAGSLSVILRVTDAGTRVDRRESTQTVSVATKPGKPFEKVVPAGGACTITEAKVGKVASPAVKNVKAEVAADKRSVKLTGEVAGDAKAAGGSDVLIPLTLVEEKTIPAAIPCRSQSASVSPGVPAEVGMPPTPTRMTGARRKMQLEFRQAVASGQSVVLAAADDLKLPWSEAKTYPTGQTYTYKAEAAGDKVRITVTVK